MLYINHDEQTLGYRWICRPTDPEYVNPSWMLIPLANLVGALAARPVDVDYLEWGWYLFSVGVLAWLALWPLTFGKVSSHSTPGQPMEPHSD